MLTTVEPDNRALPRLFDAALTAVNPMTVRHRTIVPMPEPFQPTSTYPMGRPPVRYPNLTTTPGFMENPSEEEAEINKLAEAMAREYAERDPMPVLHDSQAVGEQAYQKPKQGTLTDAEKLMRATVKGPDTIPTPWDSQY